MQPLGGSRPLGPNCPMLCEGSSRDLMYCWRPFLRPPPSRMISEPIQRRTLKYSDGHEIAYTEMLKWIALATVCGLLATAIPAGLNAQGLPVGIQIIGPRD